uniref:Uncharacterized protein n=1 Tax=Parascaris equorum TaxID=6256 RepID=A0A914S5Z7_PAREQ
MKKKESSCSNDELLQCEKHLRSLLNEVDVALKRNKKKRLKRYSPVSASLPDRESAFFLDRVNAIRRNNTFEECKRLSQQELRQMKSRTSSAETVERNVEALERILAELNLQCDVRSPAVISRIQNLTSCGQRGKQPKASLTRSQHLEGQMRNLATKCDVHVVPFGCDKRGGEEDGYLRLCAACQAIRRLPDTFFPPFINEVMCDDDKACLYFYDFRKHFKISKNSSSYNQCFAMETVLNVYLKIFSLKFCCLERWYKRVSGVAEIQFERSSFLRMFCW